MTMLPVSLAEIAREGPWALRALGYSFYVADRATRLVVWTEAVHNLGLKFLNAGDRNIRQTPKGGPLIAADAPQGVRRIDGTGRCVLEVGPPAMDLAAVDARKTGFGRSVITNVRGLCMADALSEIALRRKQGVVLIYASGQNEVGDGSLSRSGWLAAFEYGDDVHMYAGELNDSAPDCIRSLSKTPLGLDEKAVENLRRDLRKAQEDKAAKLGYLSISVTAVDHQAPWLKCATTGSPDLPRADYLERLADAEKHGVIADRRDFEHLYKLEYETWAPSSERSRKQAAF